MLIKAITYNVRGLNDARKIQRLRHYFQTSSGWADIILLQEHKLRGEKADRLGRDLFPKWKYWMLEAEAGYNVDGQEGAGKGGICSILHENLVPMVSGHGTILPHRALWFRLT